MPKNPKRDPLGSLNVFYKPKTSNNLRGYALTKFKKFRKKSHSAEKKLMKSVTSLVLKKRKVTTIVCVFLRKAPIKNTRFLQNSFKVFCEILKENALFDTNSYNKDA